MCDEIKIECCKRTDPPWESPQVIPAQIRRVDNLIFRKINQFARANGVEQATPMHAALLPPPNIKVRAIVPQARVSTIHAGDKVHGPAHPRHIAQIILPQFTDRGQDRIDHGDNAD